MRATIAKRSGGTTRPSIRRRPSTPPRRRSAVHPTRCRARNAESHRSKGISSQCPSKATDRSSGSLDSSESGRHSELRHRKQVSQAQSAEDHPVRAYLPVKCYSRTEAASTQMLELLDSAEHVQESSRTDPSPSSDQLQLQALLAQAFQCPSQASQPPPPRQAH